MNTDRKAFACRFRVVVLAVVAVLSLGVTVLQAQQVTGRLLGSVTDTSGAAVPGAPITITNQDTGVVRNTVSTNDGLYNDPQIPPGTYTVEVQAQGFSPARVKDVVIIVGSDSKVDLKVTVGSLTQTVTVTEAAPQVDTTSSSIGGIVDEQKVADLPLNGRNWTDLTLMQAGISQLRTNSASGGMAGTVYSSMGADIRSNMYLLDGAIMQNLFAINNASVLGTSLGLDGIKEYKVVTNMFGAEYGLMMGSQTVLVSKGGTNQWHGDVYDYLRNSVFDSRQHFDVLDAQNVNHCGTDKSLAYPCKRNTPYQRNNFGGAFGGPIKKDKTFVWVVYEGLRERLGQTTTSTSLPLGCFYDTADVLHATVPANIDNSATNPGITTTSNGTKVACAGAIGSTIGTGAAAGTIKVNNPAILTMATLFPQPNIGGTATNNFTFPFIRPSTENYGQIRLDQNFSAKDSAFGRYTHDDADQTAALAYPQAVTTLHSSEQFITGSENHILRPTLLNTFRASFSRTQIIANFVHVAGQPAVPSLDLYWPFPSTVAIGSGVTTWATNTQTTPPPGNTQNIVTASDDIFWTKGKHAFKFGVLYNHFQDSLNDLLFAGGTQAFGSNTAFFLGNYSSVQFIAAGSDQNRAWIYHTLGFYAQDDFRVLPRLTLNLGLRYEFFTPPRTISSQTTYSTPDPQHAVAPFGVAVPAISTNPSLHNFGPRIGLAWDVRGNGKTAVRLGGGIFYDVGLLGGLLTNASFAQEPLVTQQVITNTGASPSLALLLPMDGMLTEAPAPGTVPVTSIAPRSLQYHAQQPTLGQWNFTIDQQLPWGMAVSTSYVGSHGWHLYQVRDLNPIIPSGTVNGIPYNCTPGSTVSGVAGPPPTAANPCTFGAGGIYNPVRVNPALGQFYGEVEGANSWYNALEVVVTKRITNGLQFQGAYTFERQIDTGQNQQGTDGTQSSQLYGNPNNIDKAVSSYNIPNSFRFNAIYHVPNLKSENFAAKLEHGWWMASIVTLQSGSPFNVSVNVNRSLSGAANEVDRPNLDPSFNYKTLVTGNPNQWFNPTMFDLPLAGTYGNAPRNLIPGPNYQNVDFSLNKDTRVPKLGEGGIVQFRAEFFNIFNRTNYGTPNGSVTNLSSATAVPAGGQAGSAGIPLNGSVGKITSTVNNNNSARQIQLSLKVIF